MPLYERDEEGKLVPIGEGVSEEVIRAIEKYDDEAIVHRLTTGIASQAYIYSYPIQTKTGTKQIIGISADGASEIALMIGNIEVLPDARVDKDSDPDYIYGMVRAKDVVRNVTLLGVGRQCKYQIGKGNLPDHDRIDEHAFVKAITKAQRNGILHLTSEEIIIKIINTFDKSGRVAQLKPPILETQDTAPSPPAPVVSEPPTAIMPPITTTEAAIAEQQEKLKKLRMNVHIRFQSDLGVGLEKRKEMLNNKFGVDSLTDLSEQQLKECLSWVEEIIAQKAVTPAPTKIPPAEETKAERFTVLGFEDEAEQNKLRGRLYTTLTAPNLLNLSDDEAKKFISDRDYPSSTEIPKERLLEILKEADELVKAKQTPTEF